MNHTLFFVISFISLRGICHILKENNDLSGCLSLHSFKKKMGTCGFRFSQRDLIIFITNCKYFM